MPARLSRLRPHLAAPAARAGRAGFHAVAPFLRGHAPTTVPDDVCYSTGAPPPALDPVLFGDYQQLKRFFYLFWFRDPPARAVEVVAADKMAVLDRLWRGLVPWLRRGRGAGRLAPGPAADAVSAWRRRRFIGVELVRGAERHLAPGSRMIVVEDAGHFLHLERPEEVNEHIHAWATG